MSTYFSLFLYFRKKGSPRDEMVLTPSLSGIGLRTKQLTEENADFASRHRYHQSSFIVTENVVQSPLPWKKQPLPLVTADNVKPHLLPQTEPKGGSCTLCTFSVEQTLSFSCDVPRKRTLLGVAQSVCVCIK